MDIPTKAALRNFAEAVERHSKARTTDVVVAPRVSYERNPYDSLLAITTMQLAKTTDPDVRELVDTLNPFKQARLLDIDPDDCTDEQRKQVLAAVAEAERELIAFARLHVERKDGRNTTAVN